METLDEAPEYQISAVFKSYYVVWKRKPGAYISAEGRKV